jgi:hypothetical protein
MRQKTALLMHFFSFRLEICNVWRNKRGTKTGSSNIFDHLQMHDVSAENVKKNINGIYKSLIPAQVCSVHLQKLGS